MEDFKNNKFSLNDRNPSKEKKGKIRKYHEREIVAEKMNCKKYEFSDATKQHIKQELESIIQKNDEVKEIFPNASPRSFIAKQSITKNAEMLALATQ